MGIMSQLGPSQYRPPIRTSPLSLGMLVIAHPTEGMAESAEVLGPTSELSG